ncbi:MAG: putative zinc-binding protein [Candidatus Bathyarchaeota archaeon]|nr:putative zinc-binding protein [Candidatus Bathyarchaeota archaeon]
MTKNSLVYVIPCSGIGKTLGTVGRKATYKLIEELRPQETRTTCLALLTVGDKAIVDKIRNVPCISIDGCPVRCAQKNIEASKGLLLKRFLVTDVLRKNRNLKPKGIIKLNPEGEKLAMLLAKEVAITVDNIIRDE